MTEGSNMSKRDILVRTITRTEQFAIAMLGTFILVKFVVIGVLHILT